MAETVGMTPTLLVRPKRRNPNLVFNMDNLVGIGLGIVLTALSYLVAALAGWITELNWLEAAAVFTSYWCTYLTVKQRRFNYPVGAVSTAIYCVVFLQADLIASSIINGILAFSLIYGWFRWKNDAKTKPVSHIRPKWIPVYLLVTAAAYGLVLLVITSLGGTIVFFDAAIMVGTILAQLLLDNKIIETWFVWVIVNVLAIYVYFSSGLALAGFQYIFFLLNTAWGYYEWRKTFIAQGGQPGGQFSKILSDKELEAYKRHREANS